MQIKSVRGFRKRSFVAVAGALIVIANGVFGCRDKAVSNQTPESSSSQGLTYVDGTAEMVSNLSTIASSLNPEDNPYANRARAEHFGQLAKSADSNEALRFEFEAAKETVLAGDTIDGILAFQRLLKTLLQRRDEVDPRLLLFIRRQIAIAYLRFGEQSNCIDNHNADSCILPIAPSAVHEDEQGSDFAAKAYIALLKNYPEQLDSRWLLNIALMTLGRYPDEVPDEWLIPPTVFESEYSIPRFRDVAPVLGVDVAGLSGGSVVEDFDGDGYLDIMASSWGITDQVRYFRNLGNGSFLDMTESAELKGIGGGLNLVHADYDNDGYPDVFILRGAWLGSEGEHPNSLLRNRGDNTFYDVTRGAGLLSLRPTQTAAWGDFNNDGWVDLFVGNESTVGAEYSSELYVNNQNGTFTNVAEVAGIVIKAYVKGTAWGDYNNDG